MSLFAEKEYTLRFVTVFKVNFVSLYSLVLDWALYNTLIRLAQEDICNLLIESWRSIYTTSWSIQLIEPLSVPLYAGINLAFFGTAVGSNSLVSSLRFKSTDHLHLASVLCVFFQIQGFANQTIHGALNCRLEEQCPDLHTKYSSIIKKIFRGWSAVRWNWKSICLTIGLSSQIGCPSFDLS